MSSDQIATILVAVVMAIGASLVTGLFGRPKSNAEAGAAKATGDVTISGDAREWARDFAAQAKRAEDRAQLAEERADAAEKRCDGIDRKLNAAIQHIREQQREIVQLGGHPAPVPLELIPPLS